MAVAALAMPFDSYFSRSLVILDVVSMIAS